MYCDLNRAFEQVLQLPTSVAIYGKVVDMKTSAKFICYL